MQAVVYHSQDIQAWEQRWFAAQNSSLGLMQQAAWSITQQLIVLFQKQNFKNIAVWCGQGNNAGDGYFIASYLKQAGFYVEIFAADLGESAIYTMLSILLKQIMFKYTKVLRSTEHLIVILMRCLGLV